MLLVVTDKMQIIIHIFPEVIHKMASSYFWHFHTALHCHNFELDTAKSPLYKNATVKQLQYIPSKQHQQDTAKLLAKLLVTIKTDINDP